MESKSGGGVPGICLPEIGFGRKLVHFDAEELNLGMKW